MTVGVIKEGQGVRAWLDTSRSLGWCVGAWSLATSVFIALTLILGGPSQADAVQSAYTAFLMDHGDWSCAYPPAAFSHIANGFSVTTASPLYTLITAAAARLMNIGASFPFPAHAMMGAQCSHAFELVANWTQESNALASMVRVGFVAWLVLAWGVVFFLRTCDRGRSGWEGTLLLALASSAPVFACLESFFHPEDLMAMGLTLLALGNFVRHRLFVAGLLLGLGLLTQLFTVLAIVPLAVILTRKERITFVAGFGASLVIVAGPLGIVTLGRVWHSLALGTSRAGLNHVKNSGGTVVFAADFHGLSLFLMSRVAPLAASALIGVFAAHRFGGLVREPLCLVSLVGVCLATRLVFEVNAFGYYYMASVVSLLLLDVLRGRYSGQTFSLIWLVTLAYSPIAWGYRFGQHAAGPFVHALLPWVVSAAVVGVIIWRVIRRRVVWYLVAWQALVALAFLRIPLPETHYKEVVPSWCWQLLLVVPLLFLLSSPLRAKPVTPSERAEFREKIGSPVEIDIA